MWKSCFDHSLESIIPKENLNLLKIHFKYFGFLFKPKTCFITLKFITFKLRLKIFTEMNYASIISLLNAQEPP